MQVQTVQLLFNEPHRSCEGKTLFVQLKQPCNAKSTTKWQPVDCWKHALPAQTWPSRSYSSAGLCLTLSLLAISLVYTESAVILSGSNSHIWFYVNFCSGVTTDCCGNQLNKSLDSDIIWWIYKISLLHHYLLLSVKFDNAFFAWSISYILIFIHMVNNSENLP